MDALYKSSKQVNHKYKNLFIGKLIESLLNIFNKMISATLAKGSIALIKIL